MALTSTTTITTRKMPTHPKRAQDDAPSFLRPATALPIPVLPYRCLACEQVLYVDDAASAHFLGGCRGLGATGEGTVDLTPTAAANTEQRDFHEGYERGFKDALRLQGHQANDHPLQAIALARTHEAGPQLASLLADALEFGSTMGQALNGPGWPHLRAAKLHELLALTTGSHEEGRELAPAAPARMLAAVGECRNILATLGKPVGWLDNLLASVGKTDSSTTSPDRRAP